MTDRPLTDKGRQALQKALHVPITPDEDGRLPFRPIVLATLIHHGYLTEIANGGHAYEITAAGKAALQRETPRFLAAGTNAIVSYRTLPGGRQVAVDGPDDQLADHGYTTSPAKALPGEPEAVDDATLDAFGQHADQQRARTTHDQCVARDQLALDRRIARALAEADALGVDIRRQRANVQAAIAAMERRIRRNAA